MAKEKGKRGKSACPDNETSSKTEVCVEFVEADMAYKVRLDSDMPADRAFSESIQMGMKRYPEMTGIDPGEFVQYGIAGLDKLTLREWAGSCYGAPPTVLLSTVAKKGLLDKSKALEEKLATFIKSSELASRLFAAERQEKVALETRLKTLNVPGEQQERWEKLVGKLKSQLQIEQQCSMAKQEECRKVEELYKAEKLRADKYEEEVRQLKDQLKKEQQRFLAKQEEYSKAEELHKAEMEEFYKAEKADEESVSRRLDKLENFTNVLRRLDKVEDTVNNVNLLTERVNELEIRMRTRCL